MGKVLLLRVPRIFHRAYSTLKNFLDDVTVAKLEFVETSPEAERLAFEKLGAWSTPNPSTDPHSSTNPHSNPIDRRTTPTLNPSNNPQPPTPDP